jgi:hypothetical protein
MRAACAALLLALVGAGCEPRLDVGSDLLWTSRFEAANFDEWTGDGNGKAEAFPTPPNMIEISNERVRRGANAAKLTIDAPSGAAQGNSALSRAGALPVEAYYSAWYYVPRTIDVSGFWVIFKFRQQDQATMDELFDLDLINLASGEMSLQLYDHRRQATIPLDAKDPVVPVSRWFQIEAFYRNAQDTTGRVTFWLDGQPILDVANQAMASTPWVEWSVTSIGETLNPGTAVVYVDDCAVSRSRVGPDGMID